jgi:dephospho-CoA kinase
MGSGKSTVADILRHMGYTVLDADHVAHQVLSPGTAGEAEVFQTFGQQVRDPHGALDRRALGRMVFNNRSLLSALENIVHPRIRDFVQQERQRLASAGLSAAFYDVPLLFEKNMRDQFDQVLVVSAPVPLREQRVFARSGWSAEELNERSKNQVDPKIKESLASAVIRNAGSRSELEHEIQAALIKIGVPTAKRYS